MSLVVLSLPVAFVALVVALVRRQAITVGINEHAEVVAIARRTRAWRAVGLLVGLAAGALLLGLGESWDALGRITALAPAALGTGVLLGTIVGELTARPAVGIRRSAAVETRSVRDVLPRVRGAVLGVTLLVLAGFLALGTAWGSADDLGRGGRAFAVACTRVVDGVAAAVTSTSGPWPGSFYTVPLALAFAVFAVVVGAALRAVVRRPRPPLESLGLDTELRRWSAGNIVTAATFTVLGTLGPVATLMAGPLLDGGCPPSVDRLVVGWTAVVVGPLAIIGAAVTLGALLATPTIRVDDLPRPLPGGAAPVGAPVR